jgi:hypothetical protein
MPPVPSSTNKVTRSRERMRAAGLRPVQFWVPDTRLPGFAAEVRLQCLAIKSYSHEAETIEFAEKAAGQMEGWASRSEGT